MAMVKILKMLFPTYFPKPKNTKKMEILFKYFVNRPVFNN